MLTSHKWIVVETESTGFDKKATVIQIAIMSGEGQELFESLIRPSPRAKVSQEFLDLKISRNDLDAAPPAKEVFRQAEKLLSGYSRISFNAEFRQRVLEQSGIGFVPSIDCVMLPYSAFIGSWMRTKSEYKFQGLPKPGRKWHAMDDCKTTIDLVRFMAEYPKPEFKPWWRFW